MGHEDSNVSSLTLALAPFTGRSSWESNIIRKRGCLVHCDLPKQASYIADYLLKVGCKHMLVEPHYIDRDYMEDHSAFYARSVNPPKNYCQRVHFFGAGAVDSGAPLHAQLKELPYLGYVVIRPLASAPVGRTALVTPTPDQLPNAEQFETTFPALRDYAAHVSGTELIVSSLVFQQQDRAVSACATASLWSSLSRLEGVERMASYTPAAITTLAASAPSAGRIFPSDGLSIEQMCRVVQSVGASPVVLGCTRSPTSARDPIVSALDSGLAPILIISRSTDESGVFPGEDQVWHAVTATGYSLRKPPTGPGIHDRSAGLYRIYAHDDRLGPFVTCAFLSHPERGPILLVDGDKPQWTLRNVLIPTYHKIRFSFPELIETYDKLVLHIVKSAGTSLANVVTQKRIVKQLKYHEQRPGAASLDIPMSRYIGVISFNVSGDVTDLIMDTTVAPGEPRLLCIARSGSTNDDGEKLRVAIGSFIREDTHD